MKYILVHSTLSDEEILLNTLRGNTVSRKKMIEEMVAFEVKSTDGLRISYAGGISRIFMSQAEFDENAADCFAQFEEKTDSQVEKQYNEFRTMLANHEKT